MPTLPSHPPFAVRARLLTPLDAGGSRYLDDGCVRVDATGRIVDVSAWDRRPAAPERATSAQDPATSPEPDGPLFDLRPWLVLPGLVDLHTHIPQLPNAGLGAGLDLLTWLERYTFPLERAFDARTAAETAPAAFAACAAAGTTTVVAYATDDPVATEEVLRAAEAHGIRAIIGMVLMHRADGAPPSVAGRADECRSLQDSADLCARWNGRDGGRIWYAFTPRFAICCSAAQLRDSVRLALEGGAYWQTHLSEDRRELEQVRRAFPEARDYLDVYETAGALEARAVFAHAIHLSDREVDRLGETGAAIAHCPASNLFLASGIMPLSRYLAAGLRVGLGSDVSGGPTSSLFEVMRAGAYAQRALETLGRDARDPLGPLGWLELASLGGARALGLDRTIGSIEAGKEADLVVVDPAASEPLAGAGAGDGPEEMVSRLIFRTHPAMVRGAWVRGSLLPA